MLLHVLVERPQQRNERGNATLLHDQVPAVGALAQVLQHHARLRLHLLMRAAEQLDERRDGVELCEALLVCGQYGQVAQGTARLLLHAGVSRRQQFYKGGKGSLLQIALEAASN